MSLFCDESNITSCLRLLSAELEVLGFATITCGELSAQSCLVDLVNTAWALVDSSKKRALAIGELKEKIITLTRRNVSLEEKKHAESLLVKNERSKVLTLESKLSMINEEKLKISFELKDMKMELQSVQAALSSQLQHHKHEIKRKEILIEQLQAKLFRLIDSEDFPKSDNFSNCDKSNVIPDVKLYSNYIASLRDNIELLLNENVSLRSSIINIYLWIAKRKDDNSEIREELLKLPYESVINKIEGNLRLIVGMEQLSIS